MSIRQHVELVMSLLRKIYLMLSAREWSKAARRALRGYDYRCAQTALDKLDEINKLILEER